MNDTMPDFYSNFPNKVHVAWIGPYGSTYTKPVVCTALESCYWAETEDELWNGASWFASNGNQCANKIGWEQRGRYAVFASTHVAEVQAVIDTATQVALTVANALNLAPVKPVKYRKDV